MQKNSDWELVCVDGTERWRFFFGVEKFIAESLCSRARVPWLQIRLIFSLILQKFRLLCKINQRVIYAKSDSSRHSERSLISEWIFAARVAPVERNATVNETM